MTLLLAVPSNGSSFFFYYSRYFQELNELRTFVKDEGK
jgi:hypothetical protein